MTRRLELVLDRIVVSATLNEGGAPQTTERFWQTLPLAVSFGHAQWSGAAGTAKIRALEAVGLPLENRISFCGPSTIWLRPSDGEFGVAYGLAQSRGPQGNMWATNLGAVDGNPTEFFEAIGRLWHAGATKLVIRRKA